MRLAKLMRSAVAPAAPTSGNKLLAIVAPNGMQIIAPKVAAIGAATGYALDQLGGSDDFVNRTSRFRNVRHFFGRALVDEIQVFEHSMEVLTDLVELAQADRGLDGILQGLQRIAAIGAGFQNIVGDRGSPLQRHVIGDLDVGGDDRIAAGHEIAADLGRSAHHETGGEETVFAQIAVVRNVANVVELRARANIRRGQRRAIDRAISADLDRISDLHVSEVRDLARRTVRLQAVPEAVAADRRMRMDLAVIADLAARPHEYLRMKMVLAPMRASFSMTTCEPIRQSSPTDACAPTTQ